MKDLFGNEIKEKQIKKGKKPKQKEVIKVSHVSLPTKKEKRPDYENIIDGVGIEKSNDLSIGKKISKPNISGIELKKIKKKEIKDIKLKCRLDSIYLVKLIIVCNEQEYATELVYRKTNTPINKDEWVRKRLKRRLNFKNDKFEIEKAELIKLLGYAVNKKGYKEVKKREYETKEENRYKD